MFLNFNLQLDVFTTTLTDSPLHMRSVTSFSFLERATGPSITSSLYTDMTTEGAVHNNQEFMFRFPDDKMMNEMMDTLMHITETPSM